MNMEFATAKRQYFLAHKNMELAMSNMRKNLLDRNDGAVEYVFEYTFPGKVLDITECNVEELFEIDGDMTPCGQ